jgi:hypothetical protein
MVSGLPTAEVAYHGESGAGTLDIHGVAVGKYYALILVYSYSAGYAGTDWKLYYVDISTFNSALGVSIAELVDTLDEGLNTQGYFWAVAYEATYDRFWFAQGNPLYVYSGQALGVPPVNFSMSALGAPGGNLTSVEIISDKIASPSTPVSTVLRAYQPHAVAIGQFPTTKDYIEHLKKQLKDKDGK